MKQEKWHNGQIALTNDLNRAQSTKEDAIRERFEDLHTRGILSGALSEFAISAHPATNDKIDVAAGIAYALSGERIYLNDSISYNPSNVTATSTNGLGGFVLTPKSTGSRGITLEPGKYNYIFIRQLDVTDAATVTATDIPGEIVYPKIDDGYAIKVVTQAPPYVINVYSLLTDPDNYVYLGYVDYVTGGTIGSDRIYGTVDNKYPVERIKIIDSAVRAVVAPVAVSSRSVYTNGTDSSLATHINAVGTGTITNVNPHGITLQDLGVTLKSAENHEKYIHSASINAPGTSTHTTSALYGNINAKGLTPLPNIDDLVIEGMAGIESAIQNGATMNAADVPYRYFIFFRDSTTGSTYLPDGTYIIYADINAKTFGIASSVGVGYQFYVQIRDNALPTPNIIGNYTGTVNNLASLSDANVMQLWQIDFTTSGSYLGGRIVSNITPAPPSGISNFNNRVDLRYFGSIGSDQLQHDGRTDTVTINHNVAALGNINSNAGKIQESGNNLLPAGVVLPYAAPVVSNSAEQVIGGFLVCNGASVPVDKYKTLWNAIGYSHGGSGSYFNLPDYRGRFLRGVDGVAGRDPDAASRSVMSTGGNSGNNVGSIQSDLIKNHKHPFKAAIGNDPAGGNAGTGGPIDGNLTTDNNIDGGSETRPINAYVNYIIKY
jgi:hypothetical protein